MFGTSALFERKRQRSEEPTFVIQIIEVANNSEERRVVQQDAQKFHFYRRSQNTDEYMPKAGNHRSTSKVYQQGTVNARILQVSSNMSL